MKKRRALELLITTIVLLATSLLGNAKPIPFAKGVRGKWKLVEAGGYSEEHGACMSYWECTCPKHGNDNCHYEPGRGEFHLDLCEKLRPKGSENGGPCLKCPKPTPLIEFVCFCEEQCK